MRRTKPAEGPISAACSCGSPLPVHLAEVGLTAHVCVCERRYRVVDGRFVEDGREANPFAKSADANRPPLREEEHAALDALSEAYGAVVDGRQRAQRLGSTRPLADRLIRSLEDCVRDVLTVFGEDWSAEAEAEVKRLRARMS